MKLNPKPPRFKVMDKVWVIGDAEIVEKMVFRLSQILELSNISITTEYTLIDDGMVDVYAEIKDAYKHTTNAKSFYEDLDMFEKTYTEDKVFSSKSELIKYLENS